MDNHTNFKIKLKISRFKLIFIIIASVLGVIMITNIILFFVWFKPTYLDVTPSTFITPQLSFRDSTEKFYGPLDGMEVADEAALSAPVFCVQIPNGMDGARPQSGLNEAKVVFEAIAEAGITRFATIFQNPTTSIIGPVRSLRIYYLDWDTPFDCTIVHAGGAADAVAAASNGDYRDLTESHTYMWRGDESNRVLTRRWNNLFTSSQLLRQFNADHGFNSSNPSGFERLTPKEASLARASDQFTNILDIDTATENSVNATKNLVSTIKIHYGSLSNFNPVYTYDAATNSYYRGYQSGLPHLSYNCPEEKKRVPELDCSEPTQIHPSVVIAMIVQEARAADGVHEKVTTIGSGRAYIFQNGTAIAGAWEKASKSAQIVFKDELGQEVKLIPGQTWISAVPAYGSVEY